MSAGTSFCGRRLVSRHELLEQILAARYDLEYAAPGTRQKCLDRLNLLVDEARRATNASRHELMSALHPRYIEYRKKRRREERLKGAQNSAEILNRRSERRGPRRFGEAESHPKTCHSDRSEESPISSAIRVGIGRNWRFFAPKTALRMTHRFF